ncbi:MAG: hydrogenase expression/formation protein HypE [Bacillota bacterium]|nr:hydrogenase expression/formation protein HypE [Bacillota bacterium]
MTGIITLAHGSGGKTTNDLIKNIFLKHFRNDIILKSDDAATFNLSGKLAFTTDSFVITPVFFKGGNIGKLAVCGTVNDLAALGAKPLYLSCGFIIEEGLPFDELEAIVEAMGKTAKECGVKIVTGDTKVVQKNAADKIFINTSGIGIIEDGLNISGSGAKAGDRIIITGTVGDHGCSILLEREKLEISADIMSDCAPLNLMLEKISDKFKEIHVMRDPTRGGVAATLNEIAAQSGVGIKLYEDRIPVKDQVRGVCELLGMDPLYMANEGKMLMFVPEISAESIVNELRQNKEGVDACIIGEVINEPKGRVIINTITGGNRIVDMPVADQLPRIC